MLKLKKIALALFFAFGCTPSEEISVQSEESTDSDKVEINTEDIVYDEDTPPYRLGMDGRYPGQIDRITVVSLKKPFNQYGIEDRIVLSSEPSLDGEWSFLDGSLIAFVPENIKPDTTYNLTISEKGDESLFSETMTFSSGPFELMDSPHMYRTAKTVVGTLSFSAAVSCEEVKKALVLRTSRYNEPGIKANSCIKLSSPNDVKLNFAVPAQVQNVELNGTLFDLSKSSSVDIEYATKLNIASPVHIVASGVKEVGEGHIIRVYCDDESVESKRWVWDREMRFDEQLSSICHISPEEMKANVSLTPSAGDLEFITTNNGFHILGDFTKGTYNLQVNEGMASISGGVTTEPYRASLVVDESSPQITFVGNGRYLPKASWGGIPIRYRNVEDINLEVKRVPTKNITQWDDSYSDTIYASVGDVIHNSDINVGGAPDEFHTMWLDLEEKLQEIENGVYQLHLSSVENVSSSMWVIVSDIQLVAKRDSSENGRIKMWAFNTDTLEPIKNVRLSLRHPSGTEDSFCQTNQEGFCDLSSASTDGLNNNRQYAIYAQHNDDFNYMNLNELTVGTNEFNTNGLQYNQEKNTISIHTERGAYRPGDLAYLFAIVRDPSHHAPPNTPFEMIIRDAQSNQVVKKTVTTNSAGALEYELNIPDFGSTGQWVVSLKNEDMDIYGSRTFYVEELMPERMELTLSPQRRNILRGDEIEVDISARYLFGALASNDEFELTCTALPTIFSPKENQNYRYPSARFSEFILGSVRGTLDEQGNATAKCPSMERMAAISSTSIIQLQLSVFEAGSGRSSRKRSTVTIHPSKNYVGLSSSSRYVVPGQAIVFNGVVVDWNGRLVDTNDPIELSFSTMVDGYAWTLDPSTGENHYERKSLPQSSQESNVNLRNGRFLFSIIPSSAASSYELEARSGVAKGRLSISSSYWSEDESSRPDRPDYLRIDAPKSVQLGSTFSVSTNVPYTGKLLWTIESDEVIHSEWVNVTTSGQQEWTATLPQVSFVENVFVSVLMLKDPHSESKEDFIPARSFGVQPITVKPEMYQHEISLDVAENMSPNDPLKVSLNFNDSVEEGTVVFINAVDEGLLSLTNFSSPNPFEQTFLQRALGVSTHETIGWTQMSIGGSQAMGGGQDGGNGERPDVVKPVTMWSGIQVVPSSGEIDFSFDVPRYNGKLRVMVVSAGPTQMGSASTFVTVKEPIVVQTTLPRFLIRDDVVQIPVRLTNTTESKQDIKVSLEVDPAAIKLLGSTAATIPLEKGEAKTLAFQAQVLSESGATNVTVKAVSSVYNAVEELVVPLSSNRPRQRKTTRVTLPKSGTHDLTYVMEGWVADETNVWLTTNPYGEALAHASHIIRYPYGCVEQTSSSLRPLISSRNLYKLIDPSAAKDVDIDKMVAQGIKRLMSMQNSDGGFGYWPGSYSSHPWGSAYATHTLMDAKAAQYDVPDYVIESALTFLGNYLNDDSPYYRNAHAYSHYLLAKGGRGNSAAIRSQLEKNYHVEDKFLLMAALYHSGDRRYESVLRSISSVNQLNTSSRHYYFGSKLRSKGLMLSIHQELFGNDEESGEMLAQVISNELNNQSSYYSTQELAWSVYALASRTQSLGSNIGDSNLLVSGQKRELTSDNGDMGRSWGVWNASAHELAIEAPNLTGEAYAFVTTEGARMGVKFKYGGSGLSVMREFIDHEGKEVNLSSMLLGQLVYVRTTIRNTSNAHLSELALVDRIPAGWEIENANLGGTDNNNILATKALWSFDYKNIRDSRLEAFGNLKPQEEVQVVYAIRASLGGTFQLPPVEVEAMYDSQTWARAPGDVVTITAPWSDSFL